MNVCSNSLCATDYPHTHAGPLIDSPPVRLRWPHSRRWFRPHLSPFKQLFQFGWFASHSGLQLPWKFDCDAVDDRSIEAIADIIRWKFAFSAVIGIPRGGLRLQRALEPYVEPGYPTLIVDDVLTTGRSMEEWRAPVPGTVVGVVLLARGRCPSWVWPILTVNEWAQSRATGL